MNARTTTETHGTDRHTSIPQVFINHPKGGPIHRLRITHAHIELHPCREMKQLGTPEKHTEVICTKTWQIIG